MTVCSGYTVNKSGKLYCIKRGTAHAWAPHLWCPRAGSADQPVQRHLAPCSKIGYNYRMSNNWVENGKTSNNDGRILWWCCKHIYEWMYAGYRPRVPVRTVVKHRAIPGTWRHPAFCCDVVCSFGPNCYPFGKYIGTQDNSVMMRTGIN
jgi:hypothetical protein